MDIHYQKHLHESILHVKYGETFEAEVLMFSAVYFSGEWNFQDAFPFLRFAGYCQFIGGEKGIEVP